MALSSQIRGKCIAVGDTSCINNPAELGFYFPQKERRGEIFGFLIALRFIDNQISNIEVYPNNKFLSNYLRPCVVTRKKAIRLLINYLNKTQNSTELLLHRLLQTKALSLNIFGELYQ